jgi:DNA (cytosine-5)-methyltransferase 1
MRAKYRILDLFCGEGGAGFGYHLAGFDVVGVDCKPSSRYPFDIVSGDALLVLKSRHQEFDAFHASPPCQHYSCARTLKGNSHPDLVAPVREALQATGKPWVIENVVGAPLRNATLLCGLMFGLNLYRHRLFESSVILDFLLHPPHHAPVQRLGHPLRQGEIMQIVGHVNGVPQARIEMECPWMSQWGLSQAIPPRYTKWVGEQLISALDAMEAILYFR